MKRPRRDLSIEMVIYMGIFKIDQLTFFPSFTFITGVSFHYVGQQAHQLEKKKKLIGRLFGLSARDT